MDRPAPSNRPGTRALAAVAALTAFLLASALSFWPYTVDDAFISLRYGQNLVAHGELAWNQGEAVEGFSNPLWTLYGAMLVASGAPPVLGLKLGGLLAALLCVPATFGLARQLNLGTGAGLVAAAIVATNASRPRASRCCWCSWPGASRSSSSARRPGHGRQCSSSWSG